ncbi:flagellar protein FlaG [Stutzerimonas azotifigens]|uniref:Flagellar protein FlaG n=1 Tax=Stutzerimonas azotifigens TaxID=291995 RepID=A0ABR5Z4X7_9GAMM|nr:flagellar protein FlaG [Stutzerimonas azotifigens]MBA1275207.1 flagellar protein FlaG [Stutzerimonas azotifigens]
METIIPASTVAVINTARRDVPLVGNLPLSAVGPSANVAKQGEPEIASVESAHSAAETFKTFVQDIQRNLDFSVDDSTGQVVVKVMDGDSGKLIRQIPSEELLRLSERLEDMRSLLFKTQA